MRTNDEGARLCDVKDCEFLATHALVWTDQQYYCLVHANQYINVGRVMGYPIPERTCRPMTLEEMVPDKGEHDPEV